MSGRADAGVENSDCDSCLALGREALEALLSAVPAPNIEAVHALLPNGEAEAGCIIHPIWDLVSLIHCSANRFIRTKPLIAARAPGQGEEVCLHLALCESFTSGP
jgi:hypothetical protein